jgi:hypothetical protein
MFVGRVFRDFRVFCFILPETRSTLNLLIFNILLIMTSLSSDDASISSDSSFSSSLFYASSSLSLSPVANELYNPELPWNALGPTAQEVSDWENLLYD